MKQRLWNTLKALAAGLTLVTVGRPAYAGSEAYTTEILTATTGAAVTLTASKYAASASAALPCGALATVETSNLRFTIDGTTPTSTIGHLVVAGDGFELDSMEDLSRLKVIGVGGTSTVQVSYLRGCRPF